MAHMRSRIARGRTCVPSNMTCSLNGQSFVSQEIQGTGAVVLARQPPSWPLARGGRHRPENGFGPRSSPGRRRVGTQLALDVPFGGYVLNMRYVPNMRSGPNLEVLGEA